MPNQTFQFIIKSLKDDLAEVEYLASVHNLNVRQLMEEGITEAQELVESVAGYCRFWAQQKENVKQNGG